MLFVLQRIAEQNLHVSNIPRDDDWWDMMAVETHWVRYENISPQPYEIDSLKEMSVNLTSRLI